MSEHQQTRRISLPDGRLVTIVEAGHLGSEWVDVPARSDGGFWRERWKHRFEIYTSPTGRSVRLWVDGDEHPTPWRAG